MICIKQVKSFEQSYLIFQVAMFFTVYNNFFRFSLCEDLLFRYLCLLSDWGRSGLRSRSHAVWIVTFHQFFLWRFPFFLDWSFNWLFWVQILHTACNFSFFSLGNILIIDRISIFWVVWLIWRTLFFNWLVFIEDFLWLREAQRFRPELTASTTDIFLSVLIFHLNSGFGLILKFFSTFKLIVIILIWIFIVIYLI